ncbi:hypothetical protein UB46_36610 [Burkholderiaceae bacterium 16]|nr:hypothetical protein UB46_36610 [Burkholderiaceae bacterium 16]
MSLQISSAPLDAASKAILAKLVSNGWNKAGVQYVTDESVVSAAEFAYLLKHGAVELRTENGVMFAPILNRYAKPAFGPEVGKIGFQLNIDLM